MKPRNRKFQTVQCYTIGLCLALAGTVYIDALAADTGWQVNGKNIYFSTSGSISISDTPNLTDPPGRLFISTSGIAKPSVFFKSQDTTASSRMHIRGIDSPSGSWEFSTVDSASSLIPRLSIGGSDTSTTVSVLSGSSRNAIVSFSNGVVTINGNVSATMISGADAGLRNLSRGQIFPPLSSIGTVSFATSVTSAAGLITPRNIGLTGDVIASANPFFDGSRDLSLVATFNPASNPIFAGATANGALEAGTGNFSGEVSANLLTLSTSGSATSPALAFFSGSASRGGLFLPATNVFAIATQGAQRLTVSADGKVGIGTTPLSTSATLEVIGTGSFSGQLTTAAGLSANSGTLTNSARAASFIPVGAAASLGTGMYPFNTNGLAFYINASPSVVITSAGNLGVGTQMPTEKLHVVGNAQVSGTLTAATFSGSGANITPGTIPLSALGSVSLDSTRLGYGNVDISRTPGVSIDTGLLFVRSGEDSFVWRNCYTWSPNNDGLFVMQYNYNTPILNCANGSTIQSWASDIRFKYNINLIEDSLNTISQINGVNYLFNRKAFPERDLPEQRQAGFIAQEVERLLPNLVLTDADGFKRLNYIGFIPLHHEGIRSLKEMSGDQKKRLDVIDEKIRVTDEWITKSDLRFKSIESVLSPDSKMPTTGIFIPTSGTLGFSTNGAQRMAIDTNGNLGIGTTNPAARLHVQGNTLINGNLYFRQGAYVAADTELQTDLQPIDDALARVTNLTGYSFKWKETNQPSLGVSAQEVKQVFPALVKPTPGTPERLAVNYNGLVAPLIESVKILDSENQKLHNKNIAVEKSLADQAASYEKRVAELQKALSERREQIKQAIIQQQQTQAAIAARDAQNPR